MSGEDTTVRETAPLQGRLALVTGGSHRVGAAIVRALAAAGAEVLIHAHRSQTEAAALATALRSETGRPQHVAFADLAEATGAESLLEQGSTVTGGRCPDLLVHAAASFVRRPLLETSAEEWDAIQALNLRAFFLLAQGIARRRGDLGGDLIAIADAAAIELWPGYLAHSVSKAGLLALVRGLAKALAPRYRVNAVVPGPVLLPDGTSAEAEEAARSKTLLGRIGRPENVAQAVRFLVDCDFVTGAAIEVTGGSTLWRGRPAPTGAPVPDEPQQVWQGPSDRRETR